jgi:hypothetical protein
MLGRSKPVYFNRYGNRRSRIRIPPWLVVLLLGLAAGVAGVLFVQERYLPPRLSAEETTKLRNAYEEADAARTQLKTDLADTTKKLQTALAEKKSLTDELGATRTNGERLRENLASVVSALPPDPRGAAVEVRAGRFALEGAALSYDLILTRERASKPMTGVLQLATAGTNAKGTETTFTSKAVPLSIGTHEVAHGSVTLPEGFKPRQTTIQVLDREAGKLLGMRVFVVK